MGKTLLQIGRVVMAAFWFTFVLIAGNMARMAWPVEPVGPANYLTVVFFIVAGYAGFGMLLGMVMSFIQARGVR